MRKELTFEQELILEDEGMTPSAFVVVEETDNYFVVEHKEDCSLNCKIYK